MNVKAYFAGGCAFLALVGGFVACVGDDPSNVPSEAPDSGSDASSGSDAPPDDGGVVVVDSGATCSEADASGGYKTSAAYNETLGGAYAVASVSTGHILVGGYDGTATFGADAGGITSTAGGQEDAFVVSKNSDGSVAWSKSFGGNNVDIFSSVATDSSDNIYVAGTFMSTSIGGFPSTIPNPSSAPLQVVAKLDSTGAVLWVDTFVPSTAPASVNLHSGCIVAAAGTRVSLACNMGLSQSFPQTDGGTGTLTNENELGASLYGIDPATGAAFWWRPLQTNDGPDAGTITTVDSLDISGDTTFVSGTFNGTQLQGANLSLPRVGTLTNGFILSLAANGVTLSARGWGDSTNTGQVGPVYLAASPAGGAVLVGGTISGPTDLGGGVVTPQGSDGYVMLLSESGGTINATPLWTKPISGTQADQIQRVRFDLCGDPEFLLTTTSTLTIDGVNLPAPQADHNATVVGKLATTSSSATLIWANGVTPGGPEMTTLVGLDFEVNAKNNTLLVGQFQGGIDFGNSGVVESKSNNISPYEIVYFP